MTQGIYKIEHDGRCVYVGCARDIPRRFRQHRDTLKRKVHRNFLLQRVWDKHGDVLTFSIVEEVADAGNLAAREQFYIDLMKPWANLSDARGSHPHTAEAKQKMRGRVVSAETRARLSAAHKGKPSPSKGKKTGRVPATAFKPGLVPWNKDTQGEMVAWNKGRQLSESHRAALSAAKQGKKIAPEVIAKRVATYKKNLIERKASHAAR